MLRTNLAAFGHRYLMDASCRAASRATSRPAQPMRLATSATTTRSARSRLLRDIYDEHAGLQDRFVGAGSVAPELAAQLGLTGLAGRASGQAYDLRSDLPSRALRRARRAQVRTREAATSRRASPCASTSSCESLRLDRARSLDALPAGARAHGAAERRRRASSASARSKAGAVRCSSRSRAAPDGTIRRCHPHDPSWQNWPVLEHAVIGNIVPGLPADQQVVQPVVQRTRPLDAPCCTDRSARSRRPAS